MGYKYSYTASDLATAVRVINSIKYDVCDMRMDGYVQWGAKQDLWRLKWILDEAMKECPNFSHVEEEWLKEQEQKKIIKYLKNDFQ